MNRSSEEIQSHFDYIWDLQCNWWMNQMEELVEEEMILNAESLFDEYVIDGVDPDESEYFFAPRLRQYSYHWIIMNL